MSFLEQIAELDEKIKNLDNLSGELHKKAWDLREKRSKIVAEMILQDNLLEKTDWTLTSGSSNGVHLSMSSSGKTGTTLEKIQELAQTDYHCDFILQDGITLRFDDNEISLVFKESKTMLPFVTKYGLVVNAFGIKDKLARLKREVATLEATCHQFKL